MLPHHFEASASIDATPERVFDFLDDPGRLVAHMSERSWPMGGGQMRVEPDSGGGRSVGSNIRLFGRAFGLVLEANEVVIERARPARKVWETIGQPRLLVIGRYRLGFDLRRDGSATGARIFIDYALPESGLPRLLGRLLGHQYAKWCVRQMLGDTRAHFKTDHG